jgi:UDP-N-acetyl-D-galactosamine dehydrogenase
MLQKSATGSAPEQGAEFHEPCILPTSDASLQSLKLAVVGLGYVGLPLAVAFGRRFDTLGYDAAVQRVHSLRSEHDPSGEVDANQLRSAQRLQFSEDADTLGGRDVFFICVPTPVNQAHQPDFGPLIAASRVVGRQLARGNLVIYESTVYPGATEEICIPVLEAESGLRWRHDFHVGYSPERINPGDRKYTLRTVIKVVSGDSPAALDLVTWLYEQIVEAGVFRASSIAVAEASKVIENTQRDLNIALMNELALIFRRMGLDTHEVLEAAGTKWNFLPFRPGLVGGHCIGVDPYYLTHKAEKLGYHPQVILAGRRINDGMGKYIAEQTVKQIIQSGLPVAGAPVTVLGLTFKEDVSDLRNSRVTDLISELQSYGAKVHVHDPVADPAEAAAEYGLQLQPWEQLPRSNAIVAAVAHRELIALPVERIAQKLYPGGIFVDVKSAFPQADLARLGAKVWRL